MTTDLLIGNVEILVKVKVTLPYSLGEGAVDYLWLKDRCSHPSSEQGAFVRDPHSA
jgi:hypothetical protein